VGRDKAACQFDHDESEHCGPTIREVTKVISSHARRDELNFGVAFLMGGAKLNSIPRWAFALQFELSCLPPWGIHAGDRFVEFGAALDCSLANVCSEPEDRSEGRKLVALALSDGDVGEQGWLGVARGEGDHQARANNQRSTEQHGKARLVVPDEVGDQRAGEQLRVVVLRDVAGRCVLDCDIEAERAGCAEDAHHSQRQPERERERVRVEAGERETGHGRDQAGAESKALWRFGARKHAGPDHVDRKAGDAYKATDEADEIDPLGMAPGGDRDDHAAKADEQGKNLPGGDAFAKNDGREHGDGERRGEDKDVEHGQREMAESNNDADVVRHVQKGAQYLAHRGARTQIAKIAAHCGPQRERERHEETHAGDDFFRWQAVLPDPLDATIAEHPTGEAEDCKKDRGQVGDAGFHGDPPRRGVRVREKIQPDMT
jgi:hypothetical protein